ncbi:hypothetical protein N7462_000910, partial [Penicillium macrosclerotiorum]|uniref:uncharacterized protein n=1 Tax=Penicillium macrosclerotiorum TaxID=303699 RepID=UPI002548C222
GVISKFAIFLHQPAPSGRAVTRLTHLPWSSGHDFRLSLTPISAGDRGSIPRGRVFFCIKFILIIFDDRFFASTQSSFERNLINDQEHWINTTPDLFIFLCRHHFPASKPNLFPSFIKAGWPNGKALDYESRDCRFDPCVGHIFLAPSSHGATLFLNL